MSVAAKRLLRWALLAAACYFVAVRFGAGAGFAVLLVLGVFFEGAFWLELFRRTRRRS